MNILGLSAFYHDSAACVLSDGRLVAAAQEERFSRRKHDRDFPTKAIAWCLQHAGLTGADIDRVAFYEKPLLKFERTLETAVSVAPRGATRFVRSMPGWMTEKLRLEATVRDVTDFRGDFIYSSHHESHAASAFFLSPHREAAVLTADGVGEWTTNSIGSGIDNQIQLLSELAFPHSLGLLYSAFTQYLGFRVNNGEYKVMGLAPYGEPIHTQTLLDHLIDLKSDGSYRLNLSYFDFLWGNSTINPRFEALFGHPRRAQDAPLTTHHMHIARSIQAVTEEVMLRQARHAHALTGHRTLCMAGGVALNCVANGRILAEGPFDDLFVQPGSGDAGACLGAALVAWHHDHGAPRSMGSTDPMNSARLGPEFDDDRIASAMAGANLSGEALPDNQLWDHVAALLDDGAVVGCFRGRMEFGPRALGNRSILADPRNPEMQRRVNARIKFREGFRPFAPSVLRECASDWFNLETDSPYMLLVVDLDDERLHPLSDDDQAREGLDRLNVERSQVPAVTHVDNSARVQTVRADRTPDYHALISAFYRRTGCPIVLNTSFNLRGEPIVCTPEDACTTFLASGMDALVLGNTLILRPADRPPVGKIPPPAPKATPPRTTGQLRLFGVAASLWCGVIGWFFAPPLVQLGLWILGVGLFLSAIAAPKFLRPLEGVLRHIGRSLMRLLGAIALAALFFFLMTPIGWARRLFGDPLNRAWDTTVPSYWKPVPSDTAPQRYQRMY